MTQPFPYLQAVSSVGDGTGIVNMNGNYSVTPQLFKIQPPPGQIYLLYQLRFLIADDASINMTDYGAIVNGLTNGVEIEARIGGVISDRLAGFRVKQNWQWFGVGDAEITTFAGAPQMLVVEALFPSFYGSDLPLIGNDGDYFGFRMSDNLSTLIGHMCWCRTSRYPE